MKASSCGMFSACGQVKTKDKKILKVLSGHDERIIVKTKSTGKGGNTIFIRAYFGGKKGKHFHIDLASQHVMDKDDEPKPTKSKDELQAILDQLDGKEVEVDIEGIFDLPEAKLPPSVAVAKNVFDMKQDGVSIDLVGGRLAVKGTPVYAITWSIGDKEKAFLRFAALIDMVYNDSYLENLFQVVNSAFQSFIRSGAPNAI